MTLRKPYDDLVRHLSEASTRKRFDAYLDVPWGEHDITADDPRWRLAGDDALGATAWYQALPLTLQSRLGLHLVVAKMKMGVFFENVLSRGLLELAAAQPNGSPSFRYAYHEVIEEGQHSLMFQELINRSGLPVAAPNSLEQWGARRVVRLGRTFPELFFLFVLGGEAPIDHVQQKELRRGAGHPLLHHIMRIHVLEEARHLCFAEAYLREHVPRLSAWRMWQLRIRTPIIFKTMMDQMLRPPRDVVQAYAIPDAVLREAYGSEAHRQDTSAALDSVRALCLELGIVTPALVPLWMALGIWAPPPPALASAPTVRLASK